MTDLAQTSRGIRIPFRVRFEPRMAQPGWLATLISLGAVALALVLGGFVLLLVGGSPLRAYAFMLKAAFGDLGVFSDTLIIFLAKSRMKKYRDEPMQIVGPVTPQVDRQTIRDEMVNDPEYLEFLRQKAMAIDVQSTKPTDTKPKALGEQKGKVKVNSKPSRNGNNRKR